ncbi:MAG: cytochrome c maturation protein CcmE [Rhodospirillaceae bacterium]|jgi:cytochrome c-type biogenesis protein CcmE
MKRKHKRLSFVLLGLLALGAAAALVLTAFEDNIVFFFSPTEIAQKDVRPDQRLRVGGLVEAGSITKVDGGAITNFVVTDLTSKLTISYRGILPDLFREGQGIVAEGYYRKGVFTATEVLAKHDETYMPKEVADALQKSGKWKGPSPK